MSASIILHNGGQPFKVVVDDHLSIFREVDYENHTYADTPFYRIPMEGKRVIPTEDPQEENTTFEPNNSMLIDMGDGFYLFIGGLEIFTFSPLEPIERFYSPIGNSIVPYPWAQTKNYTYLMIENMVEIPNENLQNFSSPYHYFYSLDRKTQRLDRVNYTIKTSKKVLCKEY